MKLFLVIKDGVPYAAYPRKVQAEVYASGFFEEKGIEIVEGKFYKGGKNAKNNKS